VDETNDEVDETNDEVDETNDEVDETNDEVDETSDEPVDHPSAVCEEGHTILEALLSWRRTRAS